MTQVLVSGHSRTAPANHAVAQGEVASRLKKWVGSRREGQTLRVSVDSSKNDELERGTAVALNFDAQFGNFGAEFIDCRLHIFTSEVGCHHCSGSAPLHGEFLFLSRSL
jgi:hypothetical protein